MATFNNPYAAAQYIRETFEYGEVAPEVRVYSNNCRELIVWLGIESYEDATDETLNVGFWFDANNGDTYAETEIEQTIREALAQ